MRSMWNGTLGFGLVSIPVSMYKATDAASSEISFRQVHNEDGGRIKFRRFCTVCENEVPYEDIAKGYEVGDHMHVFTDDNFAELPIKSLKTIDIDKFVQLHDGLPWARLNGAHYYLTPKDASGAKAYALLRSAMAGGGHTAVAKLTLRTRERVAFIWANTDGGPLMLTMLNWTDEIREPTFDYMDGPVSKPELDMARQLVNAMSGKLDLTEYHDTYKEALTAIVSARVEGHEVPACPVEKTAESPNMRDQLSASLALHHQATLGTMIPE